MSGHKTTYGWQSIETAPKGANGTAFMMLAFGPPGDQTVSEGMHHQGHFYAASVFHVGGSHGERQFAFREHEVHPTHWRPTLAPPSPAETASERERLVEALRRSAQGWANVIELGLLPAQHIDTAHELLADALDALAQEPAR